MQIDTACTVGGQWKERLNGRIAFGPLCPLKHVYTYQRWHTQVFSKETIDKSFFPLAVLWSLLGIFCQCVGSVSLWFSFGAFCGAFYVELCVCCFGLIKHNFFFFNYFKKETYPTLGYLEASGVWRKQHKGTVILVNILESQMLTVYLQIVSQHRLVQNTLLGLSPSISDLASPAWSKNESSKSNKFTGNTHADALGTTLWESLCIVCWVFVLFIY